MRRLALIAGAVLLLTSCVSSRDIRFGGCEFTGATMEGFTPRIRATVNIANDSHTTLRVSRMAFRLLSAEGEVVADVAVAGELKIRHGENALPVTALVHFSDISTMMMLASGNFEGGFERFAEGLYITGSARVKAGLVSRTIQMEQMKFTDFLEKIE